jgi:hypothetical protein
LSEPLTFFLLVHPAFDYYDWKMPFVFVLRTPQGLLRRRMYAFSWSVLRRIL